MGNLFWLADEKMGRLQPFFPKSHGQPHVDDRRVLSGFIVVNRNGLRWRDAPPGSMARRRLSCSGSDRQWVLSLDQQYPDAGQGCDDIAVICDPLHSHAPLPLGFRRHFPH